MSCIINHTILNHWGWKGTVEIIKSNPSAQIGFSESRLLRTLSSQGLNISKGGDSRASLGNLFQCLPCLQKKGVFFFMFGLNFLYFNLCLALSPFYSPVTYYIHWRFSLRLFFLDTSVPMNWKKVCYSWSECKFHVSKPTVVLIQQLRRSPKSSQY